MKRIVAENVGWLVLIGLLLMGATPGPGLAVQQGPLEVLVTNFPAQSRTPFQRNITVILAPGVSTNEVALAVPPGMRLVVEHLSVSAFLAPGQKPRLKIVGELAGGNAFIHITPTFSGTDKDVDVYTATEQVTLYAVEELGVLMTRTPAASRASSVVSVIGYLEPI